MNGYGYLFVVFVWYVCMCVVVRGILLLFFFYSYLYYSISFVLFFIVFLCFSLSLSLSHLTQERERERGSHYHQHGGKKSYNVDQSMYNLYISRCSSIQHKECMSCFISFLFFFLLLFNVNLKVFSSLIPPSFAFCFVPSSPFPSFSFRHEKLNFPLQLFIFMIVYLLDYYLVFFLLLGIPSFSFSSLFWLLV